MEIKIELLGGCSIDSALDKLKKSYNKIRTVFIDSDVDSEITNNLVTVANFNEKVISSKDTLDEAYIRITGKTKAEIDDEQRRWREEYERKEREWEKSIPEKIPSYCDMARGVIREDKYGFWDEIVPIRLGDLYKGMELGNTIDILKEWNDSGSYKKCHKIICNQGHSGMSHSLVMSMIREFAKGCEEDVQKLLRVLDNPTYNDEA